MKAGWIVAVAPEGDYVVVQVLPETQIGPFKTALDAEMARDELQSALDNRGNKQ